MTPVPMGLLKPVHPIDHISRLVIGQRIKPAAVITKHNSSCAQVLLAHDTSAETLQHQQKTMKDLYILRLMVSNDTRLNMTVAIIIVAVDLPRCMIDRAIESARSLNLPPCMISSCKRDSSTAIRVHMGKIFFASLFFCRLDRN